MGRTLSTHRWPDRSKQFSFQTVQAGENDAAFSTDALIVNCNETAQAILDLRRYDTALPLRRWILSIDSISGGHRHSSIVGLQKLEGFLLSKPQ